MKLPIVITGFMGCGKTEVARSLASAIHRTFVDLDATITERDGRTPGQLISEEGEPFFRERETAALRAVFAAQPEAVVALGGGAWIQEANRALVESVNGVSIWLDVPFAVCWRRIESAEEFRPLGKSRDQALQLFAARLPVYRQAQLHFASLEGESVDEFARRIALKLNNSDPQ